MNILVVAPHPDDDVLGCGGSIIQHTNHGHRVTIVYLTSGDAGDQTKSKLELASLREKEAQASAAVMCVSDCIFMRMPDGELENSAKSLIPMVELIRGKKPEIVYVTHAQDQHQDHRIANEIVFESVIRAARYAHQECKGNPWRVGTVLLYEVWTPLTQVNYIENITDVMDKKIEALSKHKSQLANVAYDEAIRGLNRYRGAMSGMGTYCECFAVERIQKIT